MKKICFMLWPCVLLAMLACSWENKELPSNEVFSKIYSNTSFNNFKAIDIKQTAEGGYLVLGSYIKDGGNGAEIPYLLKIGQNGEKEWDTQTEQLFERFNYPVASLKIIGNDYYFFCQQGASTCLLKVNSALRKPEVLRTLSQNTPAPYHVAELPDGGLLLLTIANNCTSGAAGTQAMYLTRFNAALVPQESYCYPTTQTTAALFSSFADEFFFCGSFVNGGRSYYYYNGWYQNYVALVIVDAATGRVQETHYNEDANSFVKTFPVGLAHLGGTRFSGAYTNEVITFLESSSIFLNDDAAKNTNLARLTNPFHELRPERRIAIKKISTPGREVVLMAGSARNNQMALYAFDAQNGDLRGRTYLGSINPYTASAFIQTADGGLALLGNTTVASRFSRIVLLKLSAAQIADISNQCIGVGLCR